MARKGGYRNLALALCLTAVIIVVMFVIVIYLSTTSAVCKDTPGGTIMSIPSELYGKTDGLDVNQYTLSNSHGVEVKIINYGGIITNIRVPDKDGNFADITLGYDTLEEYKADGVYFGALVGRYANRIANGTFSIDGTEYTLAQNNGNNSLHGGIVGFNRKVWSAKTEGRKLYLTCLSEEGEEGFPGKVTATVSYELTDDNKLEIDYNATTTKPTVINLTNHAYYNLGGHNNGSIENHRVTLTAKQYTPINSNTIPTGVIASVTGTKFNLTTPTRLGDRLAEVPGDVGFDHNFCMGKTGWLKHFARMEHPDSGRRMDMYSTEPGVQFYTAFYMSNIKGKEGAVYEKYGAFCLEAQHYPDSPNQPNFPTTELLPEEVYKQTTIYEFGVMTE